MTGNPTSTAVISGASSGIGRATVCRLLRQGWEVAALARRHDLLASLAAEAGVAPDRVLQVPVDLLDPVQITSAAAAIHAWRRRLDALVTSAGDFFVRPIAQTTAADFGRMWRLTVESKFLLVQELLPLLAAPPGGPPAAPPRAVIHVASLAAHRAFAGESAYQSAMHGVIGLSQSQDAELRIHGIRVAVVSPGLVQTALTERAFGSAALKGALAPHAIAQSIAYLIDVIRDGGYIREIFQTPGASD